MSSTRTMEDDLVAAYQEHDARAGRPQWAFDVPPSIPFIGREYANNRHRILVYGNAENLARFHGDWPPSIQQSPWNRHRWNADHDSPDGTFPDVQVQPASDGGLIVTAALVATLLGQPVAEDARSFAETLAIGNFCKFAIESSSRNKDTSAKSQILPSLPYLGLDLRHLAPHVVLAPRTTVDAVAKQVASAQRSSLSEPRIVRLWQCQNLVLISQKIADYLSKGESLRRRYSDSAWTRWVDDLGQPARGRIWAYLAHVEEAFQDLGSAVTQDEGK